jgi:putative protein-disulfide isomerase
MNTSRPATLYHVHDPMCSWCWGFRRCWDQLQQALSDSVSVVNVVGGLAPDSDQPMPLEQQETIAGYWRDVTTASGAEFNFDFWRKCKPRRSTYPACRAVLAAREQGAEQQMIDAIQRAYYLRAMNPSDNSTLIELAEELMLDVERFTHELKSPEIQEALEREFEVRRDLGVRGFPSLVLEVADRRFPIEIDYRSPLGSLQAIEVTLTTA